MQANYLYSVSEVSAFRARPRALWELTEKHPRSISGVELAGHRMTRFIYVDESGISTKEPVTVVAGIIVKGNKQWWAVQRYLDTLIQRYVREEDRNRFRGFHATDLFHGCSKIFGDRTKYPIEHSRQALRELLSIPSRFRLPIVFGVNPKGSPRENPTPATRRFDESIDHMKAFAMCVVAAESYMRTTTGMNELATLVAEDNTTTRNAVAWMHHILQGKNRTEVGRSLFAIFQGKSNRLPVTKIVDTVHFTKKDGAPFMQIADACAFVIRYHAEKKANAQPFIDALTNNKPDRLTIGTGKRGGGRISLFLE